MSEIHHEILINATAETVYQALSTAQGLTSWFTSHVQGSGETGSNWDLSFTNQPSFCWQILASDYPEGVAWKCLEGPGDAAGTEVEFRIEPSSDDQAILTISHKGWMDNDPKFERCVEIWRNLMDHLKHYCESGIEKPAFH